VNPSEAANWADPAELSGLSAPVVAPELVERHKLGRSGSIFAGLCVISGLITGVIWNRVVTLPTYTVGKDSTAATTERGLTELFATDAWFSLIGLIVGIVMGILCWRWFKQLGWPSALLALTGSAVAALVCWGVGCWLGPGDFAERMASAKAGDSVPVAFALHTHTSLLVWLFAGITPILLASSLGHETPGERMARKPRKRNPLLSDPTEDAAAEPRTERSASERPTFEHGAQK